MSARTIGPVTTVSGTVGTTSTAIVASAIGTATSNPRQFLQIYNPSSSASLAFSYDGTTAVVNGAGCVTLSPLGSATYDVFVPQGAINLIASSASTPYTIYTA